MTFFNARLTRRSMLAALAAGLTAGCVERSQTPLVMGTTPVTYVAPPAPTPAPPAKGRPARPPKKPKKPKKPPEKPAEKPAP